MSYHEVFDLKNLDELKRKITDLGLNIPVMEDISILGEKVKVGGKYAPNALAVLPMEGCDANPDGSPSELVERRYLRYAGGGAGLIWWEACAVVHQGRANPLQKMITKDNVGKLIDELFGMSRNEIERAFASNKYAGWVSLNTVENNHNNMLIVAQGRSEYIFRSLREHFGWEDSMFTVEVTGANAYIGSQKGSFARYFDHLVIPLRPALTEHTVFDHWIINGEVIYTPEIFVSLADAVDDVVEVELFTRVELPMLIFVTAYGSSERNGCVLMNPGTETVFTDGLYMTNDMSNPFRWALPEARIEPGGMLEFAGRGSRASEDLHKVRMGFNARRGQKLYLCDAEGTVITHIQVG